MWKLIGVFVLCFIGVVKSQDSYRDMDLPIGAGFGAAEANEKDAGFDIDPTLYNEFDPELYNEKLPVVVKSIIYVVDCSGSMWIECGEFLDADGFPTTTTRLNRAKIELANSISGLPEDFKFNIYAYDCDTRKWANQCKLATQHNKNDAIGWVNNLEPGGATGTGLAVTLALTENLDNLTIALLSDGAPNCGFLAAEHRAMISTNNIQHATIYCFGISAWGLFEQFLKDVAADNGGAYYPIP